MNLEKLWIGDTVRIRSSLKVGNYIGTAKDGRARIKYHGKVLLVKATNLEEYIIPDNKETLVFADEPFETVQPIKKVPQFVAQIDLHIDVLNPTIENAAPQIILNHQVVKCQDFIEKAINLNVKIITIIHGKGTGQLKREVDHILSQYDEVKYSLPKHHGGATEVWLK